MNTSGIVPNGIAPLCAWGYENGVTAAANESGPDVRGSIAEIYGRRMPAPERNSAIAGAVVQDLAGRGHFYYDNSLQDFRSTMYFDSVEKVLHRITSDTFDAWLSNRTGLNRADNPFKYVKAAVETTALDGPLTAGITPESYWAAREGASYLSNGDGRMMKITASGVEEVDNGTDNVLFTCGKTMAPWKLVAPEDPFETCDLFRSLSCAAKHGSDLLRLWFLSVPTNPGCKPPLALIGPVGSGKTRAAKGISELYGIPFRPAKADERRESDFWPALNQGGILTLDNVDTKIRWLPDALASAATGGCSEKRKLYKDSEIVTMRPLAWLMITSSNPSFAADPGLADRLLVVRLNRRDGKTSDSALTAQILANRNAGLSFIAKMLSKAFADTEAVQRNLNARHPDFADFAVRLGQAMARRKIAVCALRAAETDKAWVCLENDELGALIIEMLARTNIIQGDAENLVAHFEPFLPSRYYEDRLTPRKFAKRLSIIWPHLEAVLDVRKWPGHGGALLYRIAQPGWPEEVPGD